MRRRVEAFVLVVTVAVLIAFGISFVVGLRRPASAGPDGDVLPADDSRIRVEVLNGAGRLGLAERVTGRLREHGFDVVYFGNAQSFDRERSVVYARDGDTIRARTVADALGIGSVESAPRSELHLDATVVLGQDWKPPAAVPQSRVGGWLDRIRRWFAGLSRRGGG